MVAALLQLGQSHSHPRYAAVILCWWLGRDTSPRHCLKPAIGGLNMTNNLLLQVGDCVQFGTCFRL